MTLANDALATDRMAFHRAMLGTDFTPPEDNTQKVSVQKFFYVYSVRLMPEGKLKLFKSKAYGLPRQLEKNLWYECYKTDRKDPLPGKQPSGQHGLSFSYGPNEYYDDKDLVIDGHQILLKSELNKGGKVFKGRWHFQNIEDAMDRMKEYAEMEQEKLERRSEKVASLLASISKIEIEGPEN